MILTRLQFGSRLTPRYVDYSSFVLLREFLSLMPAETAFAFDRIVYEVPALHVARSTAFAENSSFFVWSDQNLREAHTLVTRVVDGPRVLVMDKPPNASGFDRVSITLEDHSVDDMLLKPQSMFCDAKIYTSRQRHTITAWDKQLTFETRLVLGSPSLSSDMAQLWFNRSCKYEVSLVYDGCLSLDFISTMLKQALPKCYSFN